MKKTLELLRLLEKELPSPRPSQRHSLVVASDQPDVLILTLAMGDTWQAFNLKEDDFELPADALLTEIKRLLTTVPAA